jgi:hypothetical protein
LGGGWVGGWGWGQKVLSRPSADSFAVGRRQKRWLIFSGLTNVLHSVWAIGVRVSLQQTTKTNQPCPLTMYLEVEDCFLELPQGRICQSSKAYIYALAACILFSAPIEKSRSTKLGCTNTG